MAEPPAQDDIYAALDLGSNSFHLIVAGFNEGKLRVIDREKHVVRFAAGLDENDRLDEQTRRRALDSLARMAERLRGVARDHIRVVGTNTLRTAANADEFLAEAEALLGLPINIISGTEEARLIYLGVASDFSPDGKRRLVVDIGGGSTELVAGRDRPERMESLQMGCVSYSRRFFPGGALSDRAFRQAHQAARQEVSPYAHEFHRQWREAVGASGTIRSIARILNQNGLSRDEMITAAGLGALAAEVRRADHVDRLDIAGLAEDRRAVFPGGLAILTALFEELGIEAMHISDYAMREGIVHDLAGRLHHRDKREETIAHLMRQYHVDTVQAERVARLAQRWLPGVESLLITEPMEARRLLRWAACLHEIGLAIAHGGYHKHGAYIIGNADMPGFSRQEQARLSFLVLNHRRKPRPLTNGWGIQPDWTLAALFRLCCIFHRRRTEREIPDAVRLDTDGKALALTLPAPWIDANPLTAADLEDERELLKARQVTLKIHIV